MSNHETAAAATYYRTGKGSHKHLDWYCANTRRAIITGDPTVIPAAELDSWAPCEHCCPAAEVAAAAQVATAVAAAKCPNTGVTNPRRLQSTCRDCGKEGTVNRSTGTLRAHKPA